MAGLRPLVDQVISCGQFETNRTLKLVDCYRWKNKYTHMQLVFGTPKTKEEWLDGIWFAVSNK